ncbi:MAG: methionyl-tRNA formyltransferase [Candidatus Omnitrophota bacterium]
MKIVFFASGEFAVPVLSRLGQDRAYRPVCVVTQPDRPAGRGLKLRPSPVKVFCLRQGLRLYQPSGLRGDEAYDYLRQLNADLFIVVAYGCIIPQRILSLPKIFSLNIHASLLPKYRGAAPINWAIINGESRTGISLIRMNEFVDKGDMLLSHSLNIEDTDDARTLSARLSALAADNIASALDLIAGGKYRLCPQDEARASSAPKLTRAQARIDWTKTARAIANQVRGLVPWPAAWTRRAGKLLKIWEAVARDDVFGGGGKPGEVLDTKEAGIFVRCGGGVLVIRQAQWEGGKRMPAGDIVCGRGINKGDFL